MTRSIIESVVNAMSEFVQTAAAVQWEASASVTRVAPLEAKLQLAEVLVAATDLRLRASQCLRQFQHNAAAISRESPPLETSAMTTFAQLIASDDMHLAAARSSDVMRLLEGPAQRLRLQVTAISVPGFPRAELPDAGLVALPSMPARPLGFIVSRENPVPERESLHDAEAAARLVHMSLTCLEQVSVELTASYFSAYDLDEESQRVMALQCDDEARHCRALLALLRDLDYDLESWRAIDVRTWHVNGLAGTFVDKVALSHLLLESYGIEACIAVSQNLRAIGLVDAAEVYAAQIADELRHAIAARELVARLAPGDLSAYLSAQYDFFLAHVPPVGLPLDRELRSLAGFSKAELHRLEQWR